MNSSKPTYELLSDSEDQSSLTFSGSWTQGNNTPDFTNLRTDLCAKNPRQLILDGQHLDAWDSSFMAFLLRCAQFCRAEDISCQTRDMPEGVDKLLSVATAVDPHNPPAREGRSLLQVIHPAAWIAKAQRETREFLNFIGMVAISMVRIVTGRANTRWVDYLGFCHQAGPDAFAIISLTSILVGMILGYLGAVQLQQFGAEIYVADLVVIGMLREMGVLMTAVVMAGRTGAAYAAQLGTMQTNDEIDAITTMGIDPVEFLVMPRMLALITIMPLLTIYANLLGIFGGGIVAASMGIGPAQYITQSDAALQISHLSVGFVKAVVFAILIAVAGCRAGISSGRSSAAVGQAATEAVVTAIVYLIVADAAINIVYQQVGI
ncbi:MAG: ABC transporter permease [Pseudomonadota bacterium]